MSKRRTRSPEAQWCDGVLALASQLRGSREQVALALLDTVFVRLAEPRGLMDPKRPFGQRFPALVECSGDASMLSTLTPSFTEIPVDAEGTYHVELLGHLHGRLMSTEERRARGSHYTPREMAADIAVKTIDPLIATYGDHAARIASLKICDPAMGGGVFLVEAIRSLAERLHQACEREGKGISLHDCRVAVALRCIYGVDRDPTAVWLAKRVLWLFLEEPTLSLHAFDHALRHGDALVGLDREQLLSFHWDKGHPPVPEIEQHVVPRTQVATQLREQFRSCQLSDNEATELNRKLDVAMHDVRLIGDLCIGAFFANDKTKSREQERAGRAGSVLAWLRSGAMSPRDLLGLQAEFRAKVPAFHWHAEFPEVFWAQEAHKPVQETATRSAPQQLGLAL